MDMKKYLADLEKLVNIDCGSNVPEGVQEVTEFFKKELENDWILKVYPQNDGKNPVLVAKNRDSEDIDLMFLGHNDTVFPKGTVIQIGTDEYKRGVWSTFYDRSC